MRNRHVFAMIFLASCIPEITPLPSKIQNADQERECAMLYHELYDYNKNTVREAAKECDFVCTRSIDVRKCYQTDNTCTRLELLRDIATTKRKKYEDKCVETVP